MNADMVLVRKELHEFWHTWRLRLLLIPVVFFALSGPVFAYFTPEILKAALGSQSEAFGTIPAAVWQDVYLQWAKNLQQIVPFLVIVISAGSIAGECTSGTIIPIVSGGYSRARIVVIKFTVNSLVGIAAVIVGTLITWAIGFLIFPDIAFTPALRVIAVAALLVMLMVAIAILASSRMTETLGAVGISVAVFFVMVGLTIWPPARQWSPVGLLSLLGEVVSGSTRAFIWPVITTLLTVIACIGSAVAVFNRRELSGT